MKTLRIAYCCICIVFFYSLFDSPKSEAIDSSYIIFTLITTGIPIILIPMIMSSKAERFYKKAMREGRIRGQLDRSPAPVEEEYRFDSILLTVILSFQFLILIIFLWK